MTVPKLLATWDRGLVSAEIERGGVVSAASVPASFAYDGRLMDPAEFLSYVVETDISWATRGAVVHHTANPSEETWRKYGGWAYWSSQMASYYGNSLKWTSGPHAFVSYEGIGVFTPMSVRGTHAGATANASTVGIEIVGNFMSVLPTEDTLDNAVWAFACVLWKLGRTATDYLYPHRHFGNTECPGNMLYNNFKWFKDLVDSKIAEIAEVERPEPEEPDWETLSLCVNAALVNINTAKSIIDKWKING